MIKKGEKGEGGKASCLPLALWGNTNLVLNCAWELLQFKGEKPRQWNSITEWTERSSAELSTHLDACTHLASSILSPYWKAWKLPFTHHAVINQGALLLQRKRHSPSKQECFPHEDEEAETKKYMAVARTLTDGHHAKELRIASALQY